MINLYNFVEILETAWSEEEHKIIDKENIWWYDDIQEEFYLDYLDSVDWSCVVKGYVKKELNLE